MSFISKWILWNTEQIPTESDSEISPYSMVEPTDYLRSSTNSAYSIEFQPKNDLSSHVFNWNDIFYPNKNDDYQR